MVNDWNQKGRGPVEYRRIRNFLEELQPLILRDSRLLDASFTVSKTPIPLLESVVLDRRPIVEGEAWGRNWDSGYDEPRFSDSLMTV